MRRSFSGDSWPSIGLVVPVLAALGGCNQVFDLDETAVLQDKRNSSSCTCTCYRAPVTVPNRLIQVSADDATEEGTNLDTNDDFLELGTTSRGNSTTVGLRFATLGIPKKSHIVSATLQFTAAQASTTAITILQIAGEASDNAAPFPGTNLAARPKTAAIPWNINVPWVAGETGAAEKFPDLAPVIQELVNRDNWNPNNAIAILITGTNGRAALSSDASTGPAKGPVLNVQYEEPLEQKTLPVCMDEDDNPNNGHPEPMPETLQADCSGRVATTLGQLAAACLLADHCECNYQPDSTKFVNSCNSECTGTSLISDCSNLDPAAGSTDATHVTSGDPVCSPGATMAAMMFGRSSTCEVSGIATVSASGESPTTGARGTLEIETASCTGQACEASIQHDLQLNDFTVGNIFGSATFSQLAAVGRSLPGFAAQLDVNGDGTFGNSATSSSARGRRDNGDTLAMQAANTAPLALRFRTQTSTPTCRLAGTLVGTIDPDEKRCESSDQVCTDDASVCGVGEGCTGADQGDGTFLCQCQKLPADSNATVSIEVAGTVVNQPPVANAGPNLVVECDRPYRAAVTLDATGSYDPDGDITSFQWLKGSRVGDQVGFQPKIWIEQAVASQFPYIFRVMDSFGKTGEDTALVSVVDTTPPAITCNAPPTITPDQAPISFKAGATDVCDPNAVPVVGSFSCFKVGRNGVVSKLRSCVVTLQGDTIAIKDSGGVDDHIRWLVSATDQAGNVGNATCEVLVVQKK